MIRQDAAHFRHAHALGVAFEQLVLQALFQAGDLSADGGTDHIQACRRAIDGPGVDDGQEITKRGAIELESLH
ncbi:hypothetical protein G6F59_018873 [Rhizopus arrhizus]|nr:hypothetical protein G6F59_018873 [Rhizopus arrhizus]